MAQQNLSEQKVLVSLELLDNGFSDNLTGFGAEQVEFGVIELECRLVLEPSETGEEAEDDTGSILGAPSFTREIDDLLGDNFRVRSCNLGFFDFARYRILDPGYVLDIRTDRHRAWLTYKTFNRSAIFVTLQQTSEPEARQLRVRRYRSAGIAESTSSVARRRGKRF